MAERISFDDVRTRQDNLNRRLKRGGRYVYAEQRNGAVALDEYQAGQDPHVCIRTITVGTRREVYEFLHAMMVGIDLSRDGEIVEYP